MESERKMLISWWYSIGFYEINRIEHVFLEISLGFYGG